MSVSIEEIFSKRLKTFIKHPDKTELKSPVIMKGCVLLSLQISSNGGGNMTLNIKWDVENILFSETG